MVKDRIDQSQSFYCCELLGVGWFVLCSPWQNSVTGIIYFITQSCNKDRIMFYDWPDVLVTLTHFVWDTGLELWAYSLLLLLLLLLLLTLLPLLLLLRRLLLLLLLLLLLPLHHLHLFCCCHCCFPAKLMGEICVYGTAFYSSFSHTLASDMVHA